MSTPQRQQGSLMVVAIVMVVIIGSLVATLGTRLTVDLRADVDHAKAGDALMLAESGLEKGRRELGLDASGYTGEGPVPFGSGSFTIAVSDLDAAGNLLPPGQRRVISTGRTSTADGTAARTVEAIVVLGGALFVDTFPDIDNWTTAGPAGDPFNRACTGADITGLAATQGTVSHDPIEDNGSGDGSFRARVVAGNGGERLTGYREHLLSQAITAGTTLNLDFSYAKSKGKPKPAAMMMAIDLVTTGGSAYRVWSDCDVKPVNWRTAAVTWTVPAGETIERLRLGFDLHNATGGGGKTEASAAYFDELSLGAQ